MLFFLSLVSLFASPSGLQPPFLSSLFASLDSPRPSFYLIRFLAPAPQCGDGGRLSHLLCISSDSLLPLPLRALLWKKVLPLLRWLSGLPFPLRRASSCPLLSLCFLGDALLLRLKLPHHLLRFLHRLLLLATAASSSASFVIMSATFCASATKVSTCSVLPAPPAPAAPLREPTASLCTLPPSGRPVPAALLHSAALLAAFMLPACGRSASRPPLYPSRTGPQLDHSSAPLVFLFLLIV